MSEEEKSLKTISATLSFIREVEKEKLYFFMLADSNAFDVLVVKSPNSSSEIKNFLGYEWSSTKGNEGIKYKNVQRVSSEDGDSGTDDTIEQVKGIDGIKTPLFNPQDLNDESKINVLIRKTFEGIGFDIPEELQKYVQRYSLPDLMDFSRIAFDKAIKTTAATKAIEIESKFPLIKLRDVCDIEYGTRITKKDVLGDEYPVYGGGGETFKSEKFNRENCYIISRFGMSAECVRFVKGKFFLNDSGLSLSKKNLENNELDINYINLLLLVNQNIIYSLGRGSSQKNLDMAAFSSIKIPHPPLDVQKKIVAECEAIDSDVEKATAEIDMDKYEIEKIIERVHASSYDVKELSKIIKDTEYGTSKKSQQSGKVPVIRMGNIQDGQIDMSDLVFTDDEDDITKLKLNKFDILFNRTNSPEHVGKVGIYMDDGPAIFAGYLIRINYLPEVINPIYLCYIMNSRKIREYGFQ